MKTIEIVGGDYVGKWEWERPACRGVVLREGRLLKEENSRLNHGRD